MSRRGSSKANKSPLVAPKVFIRIRPETDEGGHAMTGYLADAKKLHGWDKDSITIGWTCRGVDDLGRPLALGEGEKFDYPTEVLQPEITQQGMYESMIPQLMDQFLGTPLAGQAPMDVLLFAYGQTGTGKSFTILGPDYSLNSAPAGCAVDPNWGCFPRLVYDAWHRLTAENRPFICAVSAVEFYLMAGSDLLNQGAPIVVGADNQILGLKQVILRRPEDVLDVMNTARRNRHTRSTLMNAAVSGSSSEHSGSSRGHAAFVFTVVQLNPATGQCVRSAFNVVDLAGAERPGKVGQNRMTWMDAFDAAKKAWQTGVQPPLAAQTYFINYELYRLGETIIFAAQANRASSGYKPGALLMTDALRYMGACLGGDAVLSVVVTLSQAPQCGWETWFSCKYGKDLSKLVARHRPKKYVDIKQSICSAVHEIETQEAALEAVVANQKITAKRQAILVHNRNYLVLMRELLTKHPIEGLGFDQLMESLPSKRGKGGGSS